MDEYSETTGGGSWGVIVALVAALVIVVALLVTDTPGRIADAQQAQAVAQTAQAYQQGETQRQRDYLAYLAGQDDGQVLLVVLALLATLGPIVGGISGFAAGWLLRGRRGG